MLAWHGLAQQALARSLLWPCAMKYLFSLTLLALLPIACSGNAESSGEHQSALDECEAETTAACTLDARAGERTCVPGENGFVWSECRATSTDDECAPGEIMHCFADDAWRREQYGDLTAECQLVNGHYAFYRHACDTPLVLSFDDQPVEFTLAAGQFDLSGRDMSIATDWVSAKTPWLALDLDRNGAVDDGRELFGSMTVLPNGQRATNGFEALAAYDADGDGWLTRRDPRFVELLVWRDLDQDRRSSAAELSFAAEAGLVAIELRNRVVPRCGASGCEVERARFTFRDADARLRQGSVIDVHLIER